MEIETIPDPFIGSKQRFYRLYVCFKSQKEAWKQSCSLIIGVDGAFLKWDIKRHLLAAIGRDVDNQIVPIAWAVIEVENDTNWEASESMVKTVLNCLLKIAHRMCCKNKLDNWKRDNNDIELQKLFWKIARSYTIGEYDEHMEALKKYNSSAFESLQRTNHPSWSRAYYRTCTFYNDILNNLCKSFNRTIKEARKKPLLEMLKDVRRQCMERTTRRFILANTLKSWFTKKAHAEIEKIIKDYTRCIRYMATGNVYEINGRGCAYSSSLLLNPSSFNS